MVPAQDEYDKKDCPSYKYKKVNANNKYLFIRKVPSELPNACPTMAAAKTVDKVKFFSGTPKIVIEQDLI